MNKIHMYINDISDICDIANDYNSMQIDEQTKINKLHFCSQIIFNTAILLRAEILKEIPPDDDDQVSKLLRELTRD